jgi:hypothetical protein
MPHESENPKPTMECVKGLTCADRAKKQTPRPYSSPGNPTLTRYCWLALVILVDYGHNGAS